jgi:hypothetical protein
MVPIDVSSKKQVLNFTSKGEYHFGLTVYDGIDNSTEEIIKIKVVDPPHLFSKSPYSFRSGGWFEQHRFNIPFSMTLQKGQTAEVKILPVSMIVNSLPLPGKIFLKPEYRTLDTSEYQVNYLSTIENSQTIILHYELVINEESRGLCFQYKFPTIAVNDKCVSDTLDIAVHIEDKLLNLRCDFINFRFEGSKIFGNKDTVSITKRVIAFRPSTRYYLYKGFSFDFGFVIPLFEEHLVDSLNIFNNPEGYYSLNYKLLSIPIYSSKNKYGVGAAFDFGHALAKFPLWVEWVHYPGYNSSCVSTGFELPSSWFVTVLFGSVLFGQLH